MIDIIKQLFGLGPKIDFAQLVKDGAMIIDVRSSSEYRTGHIEGSRNIPLDELSRHIPKLKKNKVIITCCASGMRSSSATRMLKARGFYNVYNGRGWGSLQNKLSITK